MSTTRQQPRQERRPDHDSHPAALEPSAAGGGRLRCWCKIEIEGQGTKHQKPLGTIHLSDPEICPKNRSHPSTRARIRARLRSDYSPRHVPDKIYQIDAIPITLTGKKLEVPVRRVLMGVPAEKAANRAALANPWALDYFIAYAKNQTDYRA